MDSVETYEDYIREHDAVLHTFVSDNIDMIPDFSRSGAKSKWIESSESKWLKLYSELAAIDTSSPGLKLLNSKKGKIPPKLSRYDAQQFVLTFPMLVWIGLLQTTNTTTGAMMLLVWSDDWAYVRDAMSLLGDEERETTQSKWSSLTLTQDVVILLNSIEFAELVGIGGVFYGEGKVEEKLSQLQTPSLGENTQYATRGELFYLATHFPRGLAEWEELLAHSTADRIKGISSYVFRQNEAELSNVDDEIAYFFFTMAAIEGDMEMMEKTIPFIPHYEEDHEFFWPLSVPELDLLERSGKFDTMFRTSYWIDEMMYIIGFRPELFRYIAERGYLKDARDVKSIIKQILDFFEEKQAIALLEVLYSVPLTRSIIDTLPADAYTVFFYALISGARSTDSGLAHIVDFMGARGAILTSIDPVFRAVESQRPLLALSLLNLKDEISHKSIPIHSKMLEMLRKMIDLNYIDVVEKYITSDVVGATEARELIETLNKRTKLYRRLNEALRKTPHEVEK